MTPSDHAREVVRDTLGIDLEPYQPRPQYLIVERDKEGKKYRRDKLPTTLANARRAAMVLNGRRNLPGRWWAVMGPEGWET